MIPQVLRLKAVPEESAAEMLARPHGGFSINGEVRVSADDRSAARSGARKWLRQAAAIHDRAALERLLGCVLRPALSLKRLSYRPEKDLVRCWPAKGRPEDPAVFEWKPVEFLARLARIIPPARLHLVRYRPERMYFLPDGTGRL